MTNTQNNVIKQGATLQLIDEHKTPQLITKIGSGQKQHIYYMLESAPGIPMIRFNAIGLFCWTNLWPVQRIHFYTVSNSSTSHKKEQHRATNIPQSRRIHIGLSNRIITPSANQLCCISTLLHLCFQKSLNFHTKSIW